MGSLTRTIGRFALILKMTKRHRGNFPRFLVSRPLTLPLHDLRQNNLSQIRIWIYKQALVEVLSRHLKEPFHQTQ